MTKTINRLRELNRSSLQMRFLRRVLLPPFLILAVISVAGYVLLNTIVLNGAVDELNRVAATTAAKLEREFALRKSVLVSTGNEMFKIRSEYKDKQAKLQSDYDTCRNFVKSNSNFTAQAACKAFYVQFAAVPKTTAALSKAADEGLASGAAELTGLELAAVNDRLDAFREFFPETTRILVIDTQGQVMSKTGDTDKYLAIAKQAIKRPVEALYSADAKTRQLVFAYPIAQGAVLAAYNLDHEGFLYPSWKGAALSSSEAYMMIADTKSQAGYPLVEDEQLYRPVLAANSDGAHTDFASANIDYMGTSEPIVGTTWKVITSSPKAISLGTLANAQILAVAIAGVLLVSFVWVGSRFVRQTVDSILGLVAGAVVFSSGQLSYRIDTARMSDKEFSQLAETMNNMASKIEVAEEAIKQKDKEFISVATHEIKAPMTAIIGNLSMLLDDGMGQIDDMARRLATEAYKGTTRLRDLVNELLDIARLESGRATFNLEPVDLAQEITDMIELQKTPAAEKNITIHYQAPDAPVTVSADKTKLEIILTNFISNGIKYNRSPGQVEVSHTVADGFVTITIQDTGLGIPKEQQANMFQKFFRVEASDRTSIPGTGLGMYVTKQFIEGMGGKLWFESEHGVGTAFHFTVPLESATNSSQILVQDSPDSTAQTEPVEQP